MIYIYIHTVYISSHLEMAFDMAVSEDRGSPRSCVSELKWSI